MPRIERRIILLHWSKETNAISYLGEAIYWGGTLAFALGRGRLTWGIYAKVQSHWVRVCPLWANYGVGHSSRQICPTKAQSVSERPLPVTISERYSALRESLHLLQPEKDVWSHSKIWGLIKQSYSLGTGTEMSYLRSIWWSIRNRVVLFIRVDVAHSSTCLGGNLNKKKNLSPIPLRRLPGMCSRVDLWGCPYEHGKSNS